MAHRLLQVSETAPGNSPIASRTRKRGTANDNVQTLASAAPSRKARTALAPAPAAIMLTPADTDPSVNTIDSSGGEFQPTFARRHAPRDDNDTRSVRSLPSAPPDQSQFGDHEMTPSQAQDGTPARGASMESSHLLHTPGRGMGMARALEKSLPKLMEAARELHVLLSDPERTSQESQEEDSIWFGEVTVAHAILSGLKRAYCSPGFPYIRDVEDICERLQYDYDDGRFETAKVVASLVNLAELMFDLTFLRDGAREHQEFLEELDGQFPSAFIPMTFLTRQEWELETLNLAVDIRTQLVLMQLRELQPGESALNVLARVFLGDIDKARPLQDQLLVSHNFRGLPGCEAAQYRYKELPAMSKAPERFRERCRDIRELLGEHVDQVPSVIAKIEDHFAFGGFRDVLHSWICGVTTELLEHPLTEWPFDTSMATPASVRIRRTSLNSHSPFISHPSGAPAADSDAVQAFIRLGMADQHSSSPVPVSAAGRSLKRARPDDDDDDDDDDFEADRRISDSQLMPPPPKPSSRNRAAKRVQTEQHIPVDPSLTGADLAASQPPPPPPPPQQQQQQQQQRQQQQQQQQQYPAPPESADGSAFDAANDDAFATPAPAPTVISTSSSAAPDLVEMSKHAKAVSALARQRNPKPPQTRVPWTVADCERLIVAVGAYEAKWSKIAEAIRAGHLPMDHPRDQQALRDKARLLKQDMLKTDSVLPPGFDLVLFGKKESKAVRDVGKNPSRRESDIDPDTGRPINTEWAEPDSLPVPHEDASMQHQHQHQQHQQQQQHQNQHQEPLASIEEDTATPTPTPTTTTTQTQTATAAMDEAAPARSEVEHP